MLASMFKKNPEKQAGKALHAYIVSASRNPKLYGKQAVPDTLEGRFELILLHTALVIDVLRRDDKPVLNAVSQHLFDSMFDDFDIAMREMGVGDSGVGKKIRFMAEGFYGRAQSYIEALASSDDIQLNLVISKNLLGENTPDGRSSKLVHYVRNAYQSLQNQGGEALGAGEAPAFLDK